MARQVKLSDFELGRTLGSSAFGRVRYAKYTPNGKYYALARIMEAKQVDHIDNERKLMAQVDYPFVVNMFGHARDDCFIVIAMECITGGELFTHLRRAPRFSDEVSKFYAAQVAAAFAHLHGKDIIHRDLKPENLLVQPSGYCKLTDFGFAKVLGSGERTYTLCGTPEYIAPEVLLNKGHGKAVDWWSLGILIYEMICGRPPFQDEDPMYTYQKILTGKMYFPGYFNKDPKMLVKKLCTQNLSKRYGNLKGGPADVTGHAWFSSVDFKDLEEMKIEAPFKPSVKDDQDTSNYEDVPDSAEPPEAVVGDKDPFTEW